MTISILGIFIISYILFAAEAFLLKTKRVKTDNIRSHLFLIEAAFSVSVLCAFLAKYGLAYIFPLIIYALAFSALYLFMVLSYKRRK